MDILAILRDIEASLEFDAKESALSEVPDIRLAEESQVGLVERVRGSIGSDVVIHTPSAVQRGTVVAVGADWLALESRRSVVIALAAVLRVESAGRAVGDSAKFSRSLTSIMRGFVGAHVRLSTASGDIVGQLVRVGSDFLELNEEQGADWDRTFAGPRATIVAFHGIHSIELS